MIIREIDREDLERLKAMLEEINEALADLDKYDEEFAREAEEDADRIRYEL